MKKRYILGYLLTVSLCGCGSSNDMAQLENAGGSGTNSGSGVVEPLPLELPRAFDDLVAVSGSDPVVQDLLANDTNNDAVVTAYDPVGTAGGHISITADGELTYTPPPGDAPFLDTFTYTLTNSAGSSQASVSAVRKQNIYVNNQGPLNGDGSKGLPFNTMSAALYLAGHQPAQINVDPGDHTSTGQEIPVITLDPGQSIIGTDSNTPPVFRSKFVLPTTDCNLTNLHILGTGLASGPLIQAESQTVPTNQTSHLVLKNLILEQSSGEGIVLNKPAITEVTNVQAISLNLQTGPGAIVVNDPIGTVKISNLVLRAQSQAGVVVQKVADLGTPVQTVEVNGYKASAVHNPYVAKVTAGKITLMLSNFSCPTDDLSGTLVSGDVSGNAQVDTRMNALDFRKVGDKTGLLDWTYRQQSTGTFRLGGTTSDYRLLSAPNGSAPPNSNRFAIATRDTAQAGIVLVGTHLSPANPVSLESYDKSLLKVRCERYSWYVANVPATPFLMYAHDNSQIFSRIRNIQSLPFHSGWANYCRPDLDWRCDVDAGQRIEVLEQINDDNPGSPVAWTGWQHDDLYGSYEAFQYHTVYQTLYYLTKNYSSARADFLGIPLY